jgi:hypothetical protein
MQLPHRDRPVTRIAPRAVSLAAKLRGHARQAAEELERWKTQSKARTARLILDQRGADMADLSGGASGLLVRGYKGKEGGDTPVYKIDAGILAELRGHERAGHGDPSGCASQATSSITDGVVSTCAGFPNALPLRSWMTWQARSSSGRCADEGNASLRVFRSAEAGLRPSAQAVRTRKAVSTSSLGSIDRLLAVSIF